MVRWALLFLAVLAVAGLAAVLLLDENSSGSAAVVTHVEHEERRGTTISPATSATPSRLPGAEPLGTPLPSAPLNPSDASVAAAEPPGGPMRSVAGVLLRASDNSPLGLCDIQVALAPAPFAMKSPEGAGQPDTHVPFRISISIEGRKLQLDPRPTSTSTTDISGRFTLSSVPQQSATLVVSLPAGPPVFVDLPDSEGALRDLQLQLDTGFIVEGSVLDGYGSPVEGALVTVSENPELSNGPLDGGAEAAVRPVNAWPSTRTNSVGSFRLLDLLPGAQATHVRLVARAAAFVDGEAELDQPRVPSVVGPVEIRLQRSGSIAGTVILDLPGATLALRKGLARVTVQYEMTTSHGRPTGHRLSGKADGAGRYRIDGVPPGRYVLLAVATGLSADQWLADVQVTEGDTTSVDWVLDAGASLSGKVVDLAGRGVANVPLRLEHVLEWAAPDAGGSKISSHGQRETTTLRSADGWRVRSAQKSDMTFTDSSGDYAFEAVAAGVLRVTVMAAPAGLLTPGPQEVSVASGQQLREVSFVMQPGVVLRGTVSDELGRPLPGARVQLDTVTNISTWDRERGVLCDADGRFDIGGLAAGEELTLWVSHPGHADHWRRLTPDEGPVEVRLKPSVTLTGVVLVAETGLPLTHYEVTVTQDAVSRSREVRDPEGRFALALDDDVPVTITVSAEGRRTTSLQGVRPSESRLVPLEIRLPPGG